MHDLKRQLGLIGDHKWPRIDLLPVAGSPNARRPLPGEDIDEVMREWPDVAILRLEPVVRTFRYGFFTHASNGAPFGQYCSKLINRKYLYGGMFALRIGPDPVTFFVLDGGKRNPVHVPCRIHFLTTTTDPIYAHVKLL